MVDNGVTNYEVPESGSEAFDTHQSRDPLPQWSPT